VSSLLLNVFYLCCAHDIVCSLFAFFIIQCYLHVGTSLCDWADGISGIVLNSTGLPYIDYVASGYFVSPLPNKSYNIQNWVVILILHTAPLGKHSQSVCSRTMGSMLPPPAKSRHKHALSFPERVNLSPASSISNLTCMAANENPEAMTVSRILRSQAYSFMIWSVPKAKNPARRVSRGE